MEIEKFEYVQYYIDHFLTSYDNKDRDKAEFKISWDLDAFIAGYDRYVKNFEDRKVLKKRGFHNNTLISDYIERLKKKGIDIDKEKLWVFSVFAYHRLDAKLYAIYEPTAYEESLVLKDYICNRRIVSITLSDINGSELTIDNSQLMKNLSLTLMPIKEEEQEAFSHVRMISDIVKIEQLSEDSMFNYLLISIFEPFLYRYFRRKTKDISVTEKDLILEILSEFGRYKYQGEKSTPSRDTYKWLRNKYKDLIIDDSTGILEWEEKDFMMELTFIPRYPSISKLQEGDFSFFHPKLKNVSFI